MKNIFILDHPPSPQGIKLNTNKPKIEENREPCHLVAMWYKYNRIHHIIRKKIEKNKNINKMFKIIIYLCMINT